MIRYNIIKKDDYRLPQKAGLVSIRQYLFVNRNNKNYLLLKLCNDSNEQVSDLRFAIKQLDSKMVEFKEEYVDYHNLEVEARQDFVPYQLYQLEDKCESVEITLVIAAFQGFVYKDGKKFSLQRENIVAITNPKTLFNKTNNMFVQERRNNKSGLGLLCFAVTVLLGIVLIFLTYRLSKASINEEGKDFSYNIQKEVEIDWKGGEQL